MNLQKLELLQQLPNEQKLAIVQTQEILKTQGIQGLLSLLKDLDQELIPVNHYIAGGIYTREILLPKGTICIGAPHTRDFTETMVTGSILIFGDTGTSLVSAPFTKLAGAGTQKCGYILEDTIWVTSHAVKGTTVEEAEFETVEAQYLSLINNRRTICQL